MQESDIITERVVCIFVGFNILRVVVGGGETTAAGAVVVGGGGGGGGRVLVVVVVVNTCRTTHFEVSTKRFHNGN